MILAARTWTWATEVADLASVPSSKRGFVAEDPEQREVPISGPLARHTASTA